MTKLQTQPLFKKLYVAERRKQKHTSEKWPKGMNGQITEKESYTMDYFVTG